jgi:hypothetical protein
MRRSVLLALAVLLLLSGVASGELCTDDAVPAATLLLPYFEVDLDDPLGKTTLFAIGNTSAAPQLVNVVLWTDLSVPTLRFNIYLTGYDIVTVNMRDILTLGRIPKTGVDVVPAGDFSLPNTAFPNCEPVPDLTAVEIEALQQAHTGREVVAVERCFGADRGNNLAVGYVTFDNVDECNFLLPFSLGYFGPGGVANDHNVLWGDFFLITPGEAFAQSESLVSLEADPSLELGLGGPNQGPPNGIGYTFYGRYVQGTGIDHREPLATTWATRYLNGGPFTGGTQLLCWRDSGVIQTSFLCGATPFPFPLNQTQIVVFDENENVSLIDQRSTRSPGDPTRDILPCRYETNKVQVGGPDLPVPFTFGWLYLNLSTSISGAFFNPYKQSWVAQTHDASGLFSVGNSGTALDNACQPNQLLLPVAGNVGGFPPGGTLP